MVKKIITVSVILCALSGCALRSEGKISSVTVSGIGTVLVQPDMVQMSVSYSHIAKTTKEAKEEVDKKMRQILDILKEDGIEEKNIKTSSLNYDEATDYINGRSVQIGQRAWQSIVVTVNDIADNPDRFPLLLDKITAIDKVSIRNIVFDTEDKTEIYIQSRELAYQKALDKAKQYADLSGQKLGKVLSISEERNRDILRASAMGNVAYDGVSARSASASVPSGEQEVTTEITAVFLLK